MSKRENREKDRPQPRKQLQQRSGHIYRRRLSSEYYRLPATSTPSWSVIVTQRYAKTANYAHTAAILSNNNSNNGSQVNGTFLSILCHGKKATMLIIGNPLGRVPGNIPALKMAATAATIMT
jgi:hypothetical protein